MGRAARLSFLGLLILAALTCRGSTNALAEATPEAAAVADGADASAAAEGADNSSASEASGSTSYLAWWLRSSGVIGFFILLLSIYFVATVVRLFIELRPEVASPSELVQRLEESIRNRDFPATYSMVQESDSFLGRALTTGLAELPGGLAEARDVMERMGETETVEMEKKASMLAVLGTLGPMIGLIGTLKGMIASFSVIARSDVQLKASEVAGGISQALVLTFEGVALSVPAIYFFALFRNRIASISTNTMFTADQLLRRFAHAVRAKPQPPAPAGGSPTPELSGRR